LLKVVTRGEVLFGRMWWLDRGDCLMLSYLIDLLLINGWYFGRVIRFIFIGVIY
jgi:hypothetical protein